MSTLRLRVRGLLSCLTYDPLRSFTALDAHLKAIREEDSITNAPIVNGGKENGGKDKKAEAGKKGKGKNTTTRGVQQLAKANVQGMAKLSTFFTKKPAK